MRTNYHYGILNRTLVKLKLKNRSAFYRVLDMGRRLLHESWVYQRTLLRVILIVVQGVSKGINLTNPEGKIYTIIYPTVRASFHVRE